MRQQICKFAQSCVNLSLNVHAGRGREVAVARLFLHFVPQGLHIAHCTLQIANCTLHVVEHEAVDLQICPISKAQLQGARGKEAGSKAHSNSVSRPGMHIALYLTHLHVQLYMRQPILSGLEIKIKLQAASRAR